jgi:hypothetical protein
VGDQFMVRGVGLLAGGAAVAADGIGVDLDQARRLEDAAALVDVFEDREDLGRRQEISWTLQSSIATLAEWEN